MTPTTTDTQFHPTLDNSSPLEMVVSREVTPLIEQARALLPLEEINSVDTLLQGFTIQDEEGEKTVLEYMRRSAGWGKKVADFWKPKKQFWDKVHEACCDAEKNTAPAIVRIRLACDAAMKAWQKVQQERARKRQAELDLAAQIERGRQASEARAAALRGDIATAEKLAQDSRNLRAPVIMSTPTKLEGVAKTEVFVATCEDIMPLLQAVAAGQIPLEHEIAVRGKGMQKVPLFTINPAVLAFYAAKLGTQFNWPGVKVEQGGRYAVRSL